MKPTDPYLASMIAPTDAPWGLDVLGEPAFNASVFGEPGPQGSKKQLPVWEGSKAKGTRVKTGRTVMVESSRKVQPWRADVAGVAAAVTAMAQPGRWELLDGPLVADMVFTLRKGSTLPKWRDWHDRVPDLSKLARSTEDALTKIVWADDARVVAYRRLEKRYVGSGDADALPIPGAVIRVWRVPVALIEARKAAARSRT